MNLEKFKYLSNVAKELRIIVRGSIISPKIKLELTFEKNFDDDVSQQVIKNLEKVESDFNNNFSFSDDELDKIINSPDCLVDIITSFMLNELDNIETNLNIFCNKIYLYEIKSKKLKSLFEKSELCFTKNDNIFEFSLKDSRIKFIEEYDFLNTFLTNSVIIKDNENQPIIMDSKQFLYLFDRDKKVFSSFDLINNGGYSGELRLNLRCLFAGLGKNSGYNPDEVEEEIYNKIVRLKEIVDVLSKKVYISI